MDSPLSPSSRKENNITSDEGILETDLPKDELQRRIADALAIILTRGQPPEYSARCAISDEIVRTLTGCTRTDNKTVRDEHAPILNDSNPEYRYDRIEYTNTPAYGRFIKEYNQEGYFWKDGINVDDSTHIETDDDPDN